MDQDAKNMIFKELTDICRPYINSKLVIKTDEESRFELEGTTEYSVTSERTGKTTKKQNAYFLGIIIQSKYVGLYLMCSYMKPELFENEVPLLWKHLKGKSCFHIKSLDSDLKAEIKKAIDISKKMYIEESLI